MTRRGTLPATRAPRPGSRSTSTAPAECAHRVGDAREPAVRRASRASKPTPSSATSNRTAPSSCQSRTVARAPAPACWATLPMSSTQQS